MKNQKKTNLLEEPWNYYQRKGKAEMRPYVEGESLENISVSQEDIPDIDFGMIARNPENHDDQWYVNREYFNQHFDKV